MKPSQKGTLTSKAFFIVMFTMGTLAALGQQPQIVYIHVLPEEPTTETEVELAIWLFTTNTSPYLGSTVQIEGDSIWVSSCNIQSQSPSPSAHKDTISLGFFEAGEYVIDYTASMTFSNDTCDAFQSNDSILMFTIVEPTSLLEEISTNSIDAWPNPISSGSINLKGISNNSNILIVDQQGRLVNNIYSNGQIELSINLEDYAKGMYFLIIENEHMNRQVQRIIID